MGGRRPQASRDDHAAWAPTILTKGAWDGLGLTVGAPAAQGGPKAGPTQGCQHRGLISGEEPDHCILGRQRGQRELNDPIVWSEAERPNPAGWAELCLSNLRSSVPPRPGISASTEQWSLVWPSGQTALGDSACLQGAASSDALCPGLSSQGRRVTTPVGALAV